MDISSSQKARYALKTVYIAYQSTKTLDLRLKTYFDLLVWEAIYRYIDGWVQV